MAKKRPNLVTGLVSSSASIIEAAQQVEREITGSRLPEKESQQEQAIEVIEDKQLEKEQEIIENEIDSSIPVDSSFDVSMFFQELNSKGMTFKTSLMCPKHISLIRNLSTVFEVPMQSITYNIIEHWYKTYKPWIDKERKRRNKEVF